MMLLRVIAFVAGVYLFSKGIGPIMAGDTAPLNIAVAGLGSSLIIAATQV